MVARKVSNPLDKVVEESGYYRRLLDQTIKAAFTVAETESSCPSEVLKHNPGWHELERAVHHVAPVERILAALRFEISYRHADPKQAEYLTAQRMPEEAEALAVLLYARA